MNYLLETKLLSLLSEPSQEFTNEEMQNAYGCFTEDIEMISQSETDFSEIFRLLIHTRIECKTLQAQILCEKEKKCT